MIYLVTATTLPREDDDDPRLRASLAKAGVRAETKAWDDPAVDWSRAEACVVRSTWNYVHHHAAFLTWAERCAAVSKLWNPLGAIRWNSHKKYLLELAERGIAVVPTRMVRAGARASAKELLRVWPQVVIKPAISAGSFGTIRTGDAVAAQAHLDAMTAERDMLVQPYLPSVEDHGERSLIFIDGELTHAVRKGRRFAGDAMDISAAVPVAPEEEKLAREILSAVHHPVLYARVDLVRGPDGRPQLMELELIEPALFLDRAPAAADRFAAAIGRLTR